jgi:hypothetical protein
MMLNKHERAPAWPLVKTQNIDGSDLVTEDLRLPSQDRRSPISVVAQSVIRSLDL